MMRKVRCHDRCQCLCHVAGNLTHPESKCPGKWNLPVEKRNEAIDALEAAAFDEPQSFADGWIESRFF